MKKADRKICPLFSGFYAPKGAIHEPQSSIHESFLIHAPRTIHRISYHYTSADP